MLALLPDSNHKTTAREPPPEKHSQKTTETQKQNQINVDRATRTAEPQEQDQLCRDRAKEPLLENHSGSVATDQSHRATTNEPPPQGHNHRTTATKLQSENHICRATTTEPQPQSHTTEPQPQSHSHSTTTAGLLPQSQTSKALPGGTQGSASSLSSFPFCFLHSLQLK